jgi:polygalacturonase
MQSSAISSFGTFRFVKPSPAGVLYARFCWVAAALACLCARVSAVTPWTLLINTNYVVNIADYGAVGDGVTTNTVAIQNAINAAAAGGTTNGLSGGTVEFPAGVYMSGPLTLQSSVNLQLDTNATLRMLPFGQYPVTWFTNADGSYYFTAANFISGSSLHDIEVSGSGIIDGQGTNWWPWANTNSAVRPIMLRLTSCNRQLIQNVTLSNSPMFHISLSGSAGNSTVQSVTIRANSSSDPFPGHNTDACDVAGTNILVQNCNISVGDDNFTCGGNTSDVLITNNTYGAGHGVSIGSPTSPSVSNMTVINCTFNNTDQGIRIKSDRDRGGFVHNISYLNLSMTNVMRPILIYCQYTNTVSAYRAVDSITPGVAASYPSSPVTSKTPTYRDIVISNITATVQSGRTAGLIWGLPEMSISNVTLAKLNITAPKTFGIYCAKGVQIVDSTITTPAGVTNVAFYDAAISFTNSTPSANSVSLNGASTNGIGNTLSFYNYRAWLVNTNALDDSPGITLCNSTLSVSNNLLLDTNSVVTFVLGTNSPTFAVTGALTELGALKVAAGAGFSNGVYTLFTYGQDLLGWGPPVLASVPAGYNFSLNTNTPGQVKLAVTLLAPTNLVATATNLLINLRWNSVTGATNYNLKRGTLDNGPYPIVFSGLPTTNFADADVTNGVNYFYVVSALGSGGESSNSLQASAAPVPSNQPTNLVMKVSGAQFQLSWPQDHLGWRLLIQTNSLTNGLGANWVTVPNSTNVNTTNLVIDPANGAAFFRMAYP